MLIADAWEPVKVQPVIRARLLPVVITTGLCAALLASCRSEPSAADIERQLQQHPDILYRLIEQHPAEIISALNKAAQVAQAELQKSAVRDASAKLEAEFQTPKLPALDHRVAFGNPAAPITIVEYSDFQCPYCRRERDVLVQVMRKYGDQVRLVVKQTPLDMHPQAMISALTYEAVARQDPAKAFKLYDELFNNQARLGAQGAAYLDEAVKAVGADPVRAKADAQSDAVKATVAADLAEFQKFGFVGTPGFLINGVSLEGSRPAAEFERIIDRHLAGLASGGSSPAAVSARQ
jgi:protein-disulfide isomerase